MYSTKAVCAATLLAILAGSAFADAPTTYTGVVAGGTQFASGMPTETASHSHATGGAGTCARTVTFSYNAIGGDTFADLGLEGLVVTAGRDYLTHLYLNVKDNAGRDISGTAFIEDDAWESGSLVGVTGALPVMSHTATLSGACGTWTLTVEAHRGAGEYSVTVS